MNCSTQTKFSLCNRRKTKYFLLKMLTKELCCIPCAETVAKTQVFFIIIRQFKSRYMHEDAEEPKLVKATRVLAVVFVTVWLNVDFFFVMPGGFFVLIFCCSRRYLEGDMLDFFSRGDDFSILDLFCDGADFFSDLRDRRGALGRTWSPGIPKVTK